MPGRKMDYIPEIYQKRILILGCGNTLFGDDGFGPAVCDYLKRNYEIPEWAAVEDCGTGMREVLFDIVIGEQRPQKIIVIDAVDCGRRPGEVFELSLDEIPKPKLNDFSIHGVPSSNLLKELRDLCKVEVVLLACQVGQVPEEVKPGLSGPVGDAVPRAGALIFERYVGGL